MFFRPATPTLRPSDHFFFSAPIPPPWTITFITFPTLWGCKLSVIKGLNGSDGSESSLGRLTKK